MRSTNDGDFFDESSRLIIKTHSQNLSGAVSPLWVFLRVSVSP